MLRAFSDGFQLCSFSLVLLFCFPSMLILLGSSPLATKELISICSLREKKHGELFAWSRVWLLSYSEFFHTHKTHSAAPFSQAAASTKLVLEMRDVLQTNNDKILAHKVNVSTIFPRPHNQTQVRAIFEAMIEMPYSEFDFARHWIAAWIGVVLAPQFGWDLEDTLMQIASAGLRVLQPKAQQGDFTWNPLQVYAPSHGVIWGIVITIKEEDIKLVWPVVAPFPFDPFHSIGHAMLLRQRPEITFDFPPRYHSFQFAVEEVRHAEVMCLAAPERQMAAWCLNGLHHALVSFQPRQWDRLKYLEDLPQTCLQYRSPFHCILRRCQWAFMRNTSRLQDLDVSVCLPPYADAEESTLQCIKAFSFFFFSSFDEALKKDHVTSSNCGLHYYERCGGEQVYSTCSVAYDLLTPEDVSHRNNSLAAWCSRFVEVGFRRIWSVVEKLRWHACIHASITSAANYVKEGAATSVYNELCWPLIINGHVEDSFAAVIQEVCRRAVYHRESYQKSMTRLTFSMNETKLIRAMGG